MASNERAELIEEVKELILDGNLYSRTLQETSESILSTILAALQEPTEVMIDVIPVPYRCGRDWRQDAKATYRAMLNASALGEQSDRAEIISADGAIWDETAPGTRNFKRREQSE